MLSTTSEVILALTALFSIGVALGTAIFAAKCRRYCDLAFQAMQQNSIKALGMSKTGELERSLTELWDSHASLLASHKRLRSKYGMQDLRERRKQSENGQDDTAPLPSDDDDAARLAKKNALRVEAKSKGLLR